MDGISSVWPKWEALEVLGEGGFGKVYKAKRDSFGQTMYSAIKVVRIPSNHAEVKEMTTSGLSQDNIRSYYLKSVTSLVDEIKMMDRLKSAGHIVGIEDFEVVENTSGIGWTIYIRMELLTNISEHMKTATNKINEVKKMAIHILNALEHCHELNIIHRDIKPANIFISKFGEYKLGDFGVSKEVERTNATMSQKGTKSYMAPEMIRLENYNKTVDLYALGLTMYELLNHNRMPFLPPYPENFFPSDREEAMLKRLMGHEFPDIEGVGELNTIIKKACHANPALRYQTATEMKKALLDMSEEIVFSNVQEQDDLYDEEKTELFEEEKTMLSGNETTIGLFGGSSIFEKKAEKPQPQASNNDLVKEILQDFKQKEGIDLSGDMLAMGRIQAEVKKAESALQMVGEYTVDLPYIASDQTGAKHLKMTLHRKQSVSMKNQQKASGFLFDDGADEEDLQRKCPYCGKVAYLEFPHGYFCRSCGKMHTTSSDEKTRKYADIMNSYLHCGDNYDKRLPYITELYQEYPKSAQVLIKYGQTIGKTDKQKQLKLYLEAYELDKRDGIIHNNIASSYLLSGEYKKAIQFSSKAVVACENKQASDSSLAVVYANHAVALEKNGHSKEAFAMIRKAYKAGYQNCDVVIKNWKVGETYTRDIVTKVINKYMKRLSNKCRYDIKSLEAAKNKFKGYEKYIMACEPGLFGVNEHGIAFGNTSVSFYAQGNYYMQYYYFSEINVTVQGSKVVLKSPHKTFEINVGKDAGHIAAMISEIQSSL